MRLVRLVCWVALHTLTLLLFSSHAESSSLLSQTLRRGTRTVEKTIRRVEKCRDIRHTNKAKAQKNLECVMDAVNGTSEDHATIYKEEGLLPHYGKSGHPPRSYTV